MRDFCILQWTEEEQINFTDIPSAYNVSDSITKPTGRTKFYEHMDIMMGRRPPSYFQQNPEQPTSPNIFSTCIPFQELLFSDLLDPEDIHFFAATSVGG